jgi:hypothetical protein
MTSGVRIMKKRKDSRFHGEVVRKVTHRDVRHAKTHTPNDRLLAWYMAASAARR